MPVRLPRPLLPATLLGLIAALAFAAPACAQKDAAAWLARAANAARSLNYVGTIVLNQGGRVETSRLAHVNDNGVELEKLVNLDGPAREVIRSHGEVRCYYPDSKVVRVEPRTFRNVFPSLSPQQQDALTQYYEFRKADNVRVAGIEAEVYVFEPKDGKRYGHMFWADRATGLLLKARLLNDRQEVVEQFAFTDIAIGGKVDRELVKPTWPSVPPDWQVRQGQVGDPAPQETGWVVAKVPPGFTKIMEGFRRLRGKAAPIAHLVYSDGLVAISVFVEPASGLPGQAAGAMRNGGLNVYTAKLDDHLVTVLGEVPPVTVRQIALSVSRR